jgi:hypothetical protein
MYSLALIIFVVSEKKAFQHFHIKRFFSETTWTIEIKLHRNDHWKVLYTVSVFYADRKFKMAATTGHSINTGPYRENTEIYSSGLINRNFVEDLPMIIPGQFGFNCPCDFREEAF